MVTINNKTTLKMPLARFDSPRILQLIHIHKKKTSLNGRQTLKHKIKVTTWENDPLTLPAPFFGQKVMVIKITVIKITVIANKSKNLQKDIRFLLDHFPINQSLKINLYLQTNKLKLKWPSNDQLFQNQKCTFKKNNNKLNQHPRDQPTLT